MSEHTSPIVINKLRFVLLALLPRDGSPRSIKSLAEKTCMPHSLVIDALLDDYMSGVVDFDLATDSYCRSLPTRLMRSLSAVPASLITTPTTH